MLRTQGQVKPLRRKDDRIIIHFDYDCFYASVVEAENPALKSVPLAIQQKQIIVTCNYEARRHGLHKLELITEAKKACPEVVIVLGEDLTRFRNASKDLYNTIRSFSWNDKVERLGFDEVWMDITDMVDYNVELLNMNDLTTSFFQLSREDPTAGFTFDASKYAGHGFMHKSLTKHQARNEDEHLTTRLRLGSHLAMHIRHFLEEQKGYTSTVGISTSKILSKLVGNLNKPRGQTTLVPPYLVEPPDSSNVLAFMDGHDIGKVPGIGFKLSDRLREHFLGRKPEMDKGLVYGGTKEKVTVGDMRTLPGLSPQQLDKVLSGPGSTHGIGAKVFALLHGIDDSEVIEARDVPRQISIEDSYIRLDTIDEAIREMTSTSRRLVERMRIDLTEADPPSAGETGSERRRWIGRPETLRLTTRPRLPLNDDGTRTRTFKRISRSTALPGFVFNLDEHLDAIADRLVKEALLPLFKRLHPEKAGWNLSLLNVAVANMVDVGTTSKASAGRDIHSMLSRQEETLRPFQIQSSSTQLGIAPENKLSNSGSATAEAEAEAEADGVSLWEHDSEDEADEIVFFCAACKSSIPAFARAAHSRFHDRNHGA
ncbi:hypothetical protein FH972_023255 [Carpinus fangiana]|uniref:UmuC domain-containing protein n=1 Tax=Carpinus fangiana TaxID=176857 RepID=A0A5N6KUN2_9ROSI|nr:hypothetical protein FH972_023255 [Carpinus fangiana]